MTTKRELELREPTEEQWVVIRRLQAIVRKYVPDDVSLVDEFIAERRAAAERNAHGKIPVGRVMLTS
jgi:hypothetical protein